MSDIGIVLAAGGKGLRMGGPVPKQFLEIEGEPIYRKALAPFLASPDVTSVLVGMPAPYVDEVRKDLARRFPESVASGRLDVFPGGVRRQDTVERGVRRLFDLFPAITGALVHDAARPFLSGLVLAETIRTLREGKAVGVGVPVVDTLWKTQEKGEEGIRIAEIVSRERMVTAQTPQGGPRELFLRALDLARLEDREFTDEASLFLRAGIPFYLVEGSGKNRKITRPEDLSLETSRERGNKST
ncbi:MAG: IspD/TarI family cytidylyltransferase [Leptospirales bacterium]